MVTRVLTIPAFDAGWYDQTGFHDPTNTNYVVGDVGNNFVRNWFAFNIPNVSGNIIAAQLKINTFDIESDEGSETYKLWSVSTPISTLRNGGFGLTSIYNDLGGTVSYGSRTIFNSESNRIINIDLNSNAVSELSFNKGRAFAIGGDLTTALDDYAFGFSGLGNNIQLQLTIVDQQPLPNIFITDVTNTEGNSGAKSFTFRVSLDSPSATPVQVNYQTANGTAIGNLDYIANQGLLTFNPGQTSKTVSVQVIGDSLVESNENFFLNLSNARNANIADSQGIGNILNDDIGTLPNISITDVTNTEGNSGVKNFTFRVSLDSPSAIPVQVNYQTANGTAIGNLDYIANQGLLTFNPGQTSKNVSVQVIGDTLVETDENFFLNLSNARNANIIDTQGIGTILNDDIGTLPNISITDVTNTEGNSGVKNFTFRVSLDSPSAIPVQVNYQTANGTATDNLDYIVNQGLLTFNPGQTSKNVSVQVIGDTLVETDENFFLNLSNAGNANIADSQGIGTILNDDLSSSRNSNEFISENLIMPRTNLFANTQNLLSFQEVSNTQGRNSQASSIFGFEQDNLETLLTQQLSSNHPLLV